MNHFPHVSRRELVLLLAIYFIVEALIRYFNLFYIVAPAREASVDLNLAPVTFESFLLYNATLNFISDCLKIFCISVVLTTGAMLFNYTLRWSDSLRIVLVSNFCLVVVEVIKLVYLTLNPMNFDQLLDFESPFSLSIINEL